jgi:RimJ/RimL family protein N-acetyltransferase
MRLPIGEVLTNAGAAERPSRVSLDGRFATLVPLSAELHAESLWAAGLDDRANDSLWLYMGDGPFADFDSFRAAVARKATAEDAVFFAILVDGRAVGYASLMRIDAANRVVEVGNILYTPLLQRTPAATEAMFLLMQYVFDGLGYRRYEWKCNSCNEPSRLAAARLGFVYEGLFRQHMIIKGRNRDTAWFSLLDSEWPGRKKAFLEFLDAGNFTAEGWQISPLRRG